MKILRYLLYFCMCVMVMTPLHADDLFFASEPVQDGLRVFDMSDTFANIYEKLNGVKWGGKNINVAIESLEKLNPNAHIAATDERIILVWKDEIIGNYMRPTSGDWKSFGQITTAIVLKLRANDAFLRRASESEIYQIVVSSLMRGIDENGKYIYSRAAELHDSEHVLTHTGLEVERNRRGNFLVNRVYKDSPADVAGVRQGDVIVAVDGVSSANISDDDFAGMISGYNSGVVKLKIMRSSESMDVVLRRATIVMADADIIYRDASADGAILEIVVHNVSNGAVNIIAEALKKYPNITGVILDMRTTTGGDERVAAKLAGLFIGEKPVMRVSQTASEELEIVPAAQAMTDAPVVVLITNMTRGAAEGVVAAFYENKRGVLVGTPTAGRARIATHIDLDNGGALELLNKSIKTSSGRAIDGRGMFPIVCLSNIRSSQQENAFFLNIINNTFNYQDLNQDTEHSVDDLRRGCPTIISGADEDAVARGVAVKILMDKTVYNRLVAE